MKNVSNNFGKTKAPSALFKEAFRIWRDQLQNWATSGELLSAAAHALVLNEIPENLLNLNKKLMSSDWSVIPRIEFLSSRRINGALGAWSSSTRKIYLNEDWLATASRWSILQVLTEEFGHYLDSLVNEEDTHGDEGEKFQRILLEDAF